MVDSNLEGIQVGIYTVECTLSTEQDFDPDYLEPFIPTWHSDELLHAACTLQSLQLTNCSQTGQYKHQDSCGPLGCSVQQFITVPYRAFFF